eukprot:1040028-Prorocentrum_minimum.AAC.2
MASINGSRHLHANHTASLALLACMTIRHPAASSSSGGATSVVSATRQCNISQRNYRPCSVCAYSVSQEPHQVRSNMPHQSQQVHHDRHGSSGVNMYVPPGFQSLNKDRAAEHDGTLHRHFTPEDLALSRKLLAGTSLGQFIQHRDSRSDPTRATSQQRRPRGEVVTVDASMNVAQAMKVYIYNERGHFIVHYTISMAVQWHQETRRRRRTRLF